jgi:hypothetical protein
VELGDGASLKVVGNNETTSVVDSKGGSVTKVGNSEVNTEDTSSDSEESPALEVDDTADCSVDGVSDGRGDLSGEDVAEVAEGTSEVDMAGTPLVVEVLPSPEVGEGGGCT